MNSFLSITKDFIISAVIAVLTADLFKLSNLVYQITIAILILLLLFLLLRRLDKLAKRIEILSVMYCESFLRPLLHALENKMKKENDITKFKILIIIPKKLDEIVLIQNHLKTLEKMSIDASGLRSYNFNVYGKSIGNSELLIFDTPTNWVSGLNYFLANNKIKKRDISRLLVKMSDDIKNYTKKYFREEKYLKQLNFITLSDFNKYY